MSTAIRVSKALFEAAKSQGELNNRSAVKQLEHWARLGKAMDAQNTFTDVEYDALWDSALDAREEPLSVHFAEQGQSHVGVLSLEEDTIYRISPDGSKTPLE